MGSVDTCKSGAEDDAEGIGGGLEDVDVDVEEEDEEDVFFLLIALVDRGLLLRRRFAAMDVKLLLPERLELAIKVDEDARQDVEGAAALFANCLSIVFVYRRSQMQTIFNLSCLSIWISFKSRRIRAYGLIRNQR